MQMQRFARKPVADLSGEKIKRRSNDIHAPIKQQALGHDLVMETTAIYLRV